MRHLVLWILLIMLFACVACSPAAPTLTPMPTADAKATETQIAKIIFATQTASVPTATSTPTIPPTPTRAPGILFNDDFSSEKTSRANGWAFGASSNGTVDRTWGPNQYTLAVKKQYSISYQLLQETYSNFGVEIEAQPTSSYAEYGIVFRVSGSGSSSSDYVFDITTDGDCRLRKEADGQWTENPLIPITPSAKINPGKSKNTLGVIADGSEISLYINGFLVSTINDSSIAKGLVGFYTSSGDSDRADVVLSRFTIMTVDQAKTAMGNVRAALATPTRTVTPTPKATATRTRTSTPRATATPAPPAKIVATMPNPIPCTPWSSNGCQWNFTVTFTEQNGGFAVITRVSRRYIDSKGQVWTITGSEWQTVDLGVSAHGTNHYDSWVRTSPGNEPDLRNGTVTVNYEGRDVLGNTFEGSVSSKLDPAP